MHFKIKIHILLTTFLKDIFASVGSTTFFHIKTNDMNIIVPIPYDPSLDTNLLKSFRKELYKQSEYDKAELPPELKETVHLEREITIIYPSADFENFNYLKFYLWLNKYSFDRTINPDFSKHILYYLQYFGCNNKKLLFLLFENINYLSRYTDAALFCFFEEVRKYQSLLDLFLNDSNENIDLSFKKSYYLWQLECILIPETYTLEILKTGSQISIELFLRNKKNSSSIIKFYRKNKDNETKLIINVHIKIINDAINKSKNEFSKDLKTFDSLKTCAKIFEALEYLATENKLAKSECVKGKLLIGNHEHEDIPIFNSINHLLKFNISLGYPVCDVCIEILSEFVNLNDILNILDSGLCHEIVLSSTFCIIKSLGEMKRIFSYVDTVKIEENQKSNKIKLFIRNSTIKNNKPIFSEVFLVGELNNQEAREMYSSFGLLEFLGPINEIFT